MGYGSEYAGGTLVGDYLVSLGFGRVAGKVWEALPERITSPVERFGGFISERTVGKVQSAAKDYLTREYFEKGPLEWRGIPERIVGLVTRTKPSLSYGEVGITTWETWGAKGAEAIPWGLPYSKMGWELTEVPRMGGVMISKVPSLAEESLSISANVAKLLTAGELEGLKQLAFESAKEQPLSFKGGKEAVTKPYEGVQSLGSFTKVHYTMGFSSTYGFEKPHLPPKDILDLMREQKLLPFATQTQVTRMGIFPYQPSIHIGDVASKASSLVVGVGLTSLPKAISSMLPKLGKGKAVGFEDMALPRLRLDVMLTPQEKQKEKAILMVMPNISERLGEIQMPDISAYQVSREKQVPLQSLKQGLLLDMPTPTLTVPSFSGFGSFSISGGSGLSGFGKRMRGAWFKRSHPIPTYKMIAKRFGVWKK
jgi:hypothetical protein